MKTLTKILFTATLFIFAVANILAQNVKVGDILTANNDIEYKITSLSPKPNEVEVSTSGKDIKNANIPANITYKNIKFSVTKISHGSFYERKKLVSVSIPNTVKVIEENAFYRCTSLTSVTIPNSVTEIGEDAFFRCTSLTSINIPASLIKIHRQVFSGCDKLKKISVDVNNKNFYFEDGILFNKDKNIIIQYLSSKTNASYTIPNTVTKIEEDAFWGNIYLTHIIIPSSVKYINGSFRSCINLATITSYMEKVINFGEFSYTFYDINTDQNKRKLYVPAGTVAKYKNSYWTQFTDNILVIEPKLGKSFTENNIHYFVTSQSPRTVRVINKRYHEYKGDLIIPESVNHNGYNYKVTEISINAFSNSIYLNSVTIPASVTRIGVYSFYNCPSLVTITSYIDKNIDNVLSSDAFYNIIASNKTLYVPKGKVAEYKASKWKKDFTDNIKEMGSEQQIIGYKFTDNGIDYKITSNSPHTVEVIKKMKGYYAGDITIPISVKNNGYNYLVTSIGYSAFNFCESLTSLNIPYSVIKIAEDAFEKSSKLQFINVDDNNSYFSSINGVLFSKNLKTLIKYPRGKSANRYNITNFVNEIGDNAFYGCNYLTQITIPSVARIGKNAFSNCTSLTSVTMSYVGRIGKNAFSNCTSLISITMPKNVKKIEDYAFSNCTSLTSITLPLSVTYIGSYVFSGCNKLNTILSEIDKNIDKVLSSNTFHNIMASNKTLYVPKNKVAEYKANKWTQYTNNIKEIGTEPEKGHIFKYNNIIYEITSLSTVSILGKQKFSGKITIPETVYDEKGNIYSVTMMRGYAFYHSESLTSITLPNSLTNISPCAFEGCTSLTSVTIPNSVFKIQESAFEGCTSLTSVTIPNSVTMIDSQAFKGCTSLTSLTIPASLERISKYAFKNLSLKFINVDANNKYFSSVDGVLFNKDKTELMKYPEGKSGAYIIPNSVKRIGLNAFEECNLTSVTIPASVKNIRENAFRHCSKLSTIISYIDKNIYDVFLYYEYENAFIKNTATNKTLYVPKNKVAEYKASKWKEYTTNIKEMEVGNTFIKDDIAYKITSQMPRTVEVTQKNPKYTNAVINIPKTVLHNGNKYSVTGIGVMAFAMCNLTSVTIPNTVTNIKFFAFAMCNLTSITLPASVTEIAKDAFQVCNKLKYINVDEKNNSFSSVDGILFSKDKTVLIKYPEGKSGVTYTIPNSITNIEENAFNRCTSLTSITIPSSVTRIGDGAFYRCTSLTSITIPASVKYIGSVVFTNCSKLSTITSYIDTDIDKVVYYSNNTFLDIDVEKTKRTLQVPKDKAKFYKSSTWREYTSNIIEMGSLSISPSEEIKGIKIYPNPLVNELHINHNEIIDNILVYDIIGKQHIKLQPKTSTLTVPFFELPKGVYLVKIESNHKTKVVRIIKK